MIDREDPVRGWYPSAESEPAAREAWYSIPSPDGESMETPKKWRWVRVLAVCLCVALLAGGVLTVLLQARRAKAWVSALAEAQAGTGTEYPTESYTDYRDYLETVYRQSDTITIPRYPAETELQMELSPEPAEPLRLQEIYERVSPAVVGIVTRRQGISYTWGTGVLFSPDGYLITNNHVISGCDGASVIFPDGGEFEAWFVGGDSASDIAILKIDGSDFPYAEFGDSELLRVGDEVAAIGNPIGANYAGTMTNGIISAIDRNMRNNGHTMELLQTNAALNEGNSGGPLVNGYGQVIGITNMKILTYFATTVEGIGFAIPSAEVKRNSASRLRLRRSHHRNHRRQREHGGPVDLRSAGGRVCQRGQGGL